MHADESETYDGPSISLPGHKGSLVIYNASVGFAEYLERKGIDPDDPRARDAAFGSYTEMLKRAVEARNLLAQIVEADPSTYDRDGDPECWFCDLGHEMDWIHAPDCVFSKARELVLTTEPER